MVHIKLNTNEAEIILKKNVGEKDLDGLIKCLDNIRVVKINCRNITTSKIDTKILSIIVRLCLSFTKQKRIIRLVRTSKELKRALKNLKLDIYM